MDKSGELQSTLRIEDVPTVRAMVAQKLREAIMSGTLKPGQRLVERELCEMTGVSRPSIREALRLPRGRARQDVGHRRAGTPRPDDSSNEGPMSASDSTAGPDLATGIAVDTLGDGTMLAGHVGQEPVLLASLLWRWGCGSQRRERQRCRACASG